MKLQVKALLLLGSMLLALMAPVYFTTRNGLMDTLATLERHAFEADLNALQNSLQFVASANVDGLSDWAYWDDCYQFVHDKNQAFITSNLASHDILDKIGLHFLSFWSPNGKLVYSIAQTPQRDRVLPLNKALQQAILAEKPFFFRPLPQNTAPKHPQITWLYDPHGALIVAAYPITRSNMLGPAGGYLIAGRYLDGPMRQKIQELTKLSFTVEKLSPHRHQNEKDTLHNNISPHPRNPLWQQGHFHITNRNNTPLMTVVADSKRSFYHYGDKVLEQMLWFLFSLTAVALIGGYVLLEHQVLRRVRKVSEDIVRASLDLSVRANVPGDSEDEIGTLVLTLNDMLEQLSYNAEQLLEAKQQAESALKAKASFLDNMSHELRTPLNGVVGMCQWLQDRERTPEEQDALHTIQTCSDTLLELINNILDLSKVDAGKLQLEATPFALHPWLDDLCCIGKALIRNPAVEFECVKTEPLPQYVIGDRYRLKQIVLNFLSNAAKFTHAGHVRFEVLTTTMDTDANTGTLQFSISDTGIGLTPTEQAIIFEAFTQSDSSTTRHYGGTGLGLALCQTLANAMGAKITLDSEKGVGSRFALTVTLPIATMINDANQPATACCDPYKTTESSPPSSTTKAHNTDRHILLVEDNLVNQKVALRLLEKLGASVVIASDGQAALDILAQQAFDLVLMDCQMPVMDGYAATREIRSNPIWKNLPIVALTAHAQEDDRERCRDAGMNDYLSKPIDKKALEDILNKWLLKPATD